MKLKPEILTHPNIPKPMHGLAPRTIMGQAWWDKERKKAYASSNYRCIACGIPKEEAKVHQWLEAHEFWEIDYKTGTCRIKSIEPLCHYCHNFIHSQRLEAIMNNEKYYDEVIAILEHGFKVLSENKLKCFPGTLDVANSIGARTFGVKAYKLEVNPDVKWGDWRLVFQGKKYKSKFKNHKEWEVYYKI